MFIRPKKIIGITREKVIAIEVIDPVTKKFGKSYEFGWDYATLDMVLTEVVKKFNSKDFRILVSDDLGYVVRMNVPDEVPRDRTRQYLLEKLTEKVPEPVEEGEWDYRELKGTSSKGRDVITFALVKSFARALFPATIKAGLSVEAIEPEVIAKTRDANAYIGLALKEDVSGRDEDVLNIKANNVQIQATKTPEGISPPPESPPRKVSFKLFILLIPLVLLGILLGGFFYLNRNTPKEVDTSQTEVNEPTPIPTETPEPVKSEKPAEINVKTLKVLIKNGSGRAGEAGVVVDTLKFEGFELFETENADSFAYSQTEVSLKEKYQVIFETIERALNSDYDVARGESLDDDFGYDVVIIVGERKG